MVCVNLKGDASFFNDSGLHHAAQQKTQLVPCIAGVHGSSTLR
jgi:hypothetical protein